MQVLVRELNHLKQQLKALRQASQLCCFGLQSDELCDDVKKNSNKKNHVTEMQ